MYIYQYICIYAVCLHVTHICDLVSEIQKKCIPCFFTRLIYSLCIQTILTNLGVQNHSVIERN